MKRLCWFVYGIVFCCVCFTYWSILCGLFFIWVLLIVVLFVLFCLCGMVCFDLRCFVFALWLWYYGRLCFVSCGFGFGIRGVCLIGKLWYLWWWALRFVVIWWDACVVWLGFLCVFNICVWLFWVYVVWVGIILGGLFVFDWFSCYVFIVVVCCIGCQFVLYTRYFDFVLVWLFGVCGIVSVLLLSCCLFGLGEFWFR